MLFFYLAAAVPALPTPTPDPASLERWLAEIATGSKKALEELYHHTSSSIYSFSLSILKNSQDSEDVLHDCYVQIWLAAGSYQPLGKPMAWILTITRNLCFKKLRERKQSSDLPEEEWSFSLTAPDSLSSEERILLQEALARLSDEERQIVVLHAVSGFKHREIAAFLTMPLSTVLSKYNRAIKKLQRYLREEGAL